MSCLSGLESLKLSLGDGEFCGGGRSGVRYSLELGVLIILNKT